MMLAPSQRVTTSKRLPSPGTSPVARGPADPPDDPVALPMLPMVNPLSLGAGNVPAVTREEPLVAPRRVARGVVAFDLDGTLLDDMDPISEVAADVLNRAFGTPRPAARLQYLATTGLPFEAQLAQLYPEVPKEKRGEVAALFHARKAKEAYTQSTRFPEVPRLLKRLDQAHWTLAITTGAERELADLLLEREGIRIWFEAILGSGQGTKREHLAELRRRFPRAPLFLVGDSRFDLEAASDLGVPMLARASRHGEWALTPEVFRGWGAAWADYSLAELPEVLDGLSARPPAGHSARRSARTKARKPT
jgi:phosphoglycolate phosphatase-like HAD superfamily hydrolase